MNSTSSVAPSPKSRILATEIRRPKSNLAPNPKFMLPKQKKANGFLGVFNWNYSGDPRKTLLKIAFAPLMNMSSMGTNAAPAARGPDERKAKRTRNQQIAEWEKKRDDQHLSQYVTLKKVNGDDPYFLLAVPIVRFSSGEGVDSILLMFDGATLTEEARAAIPTKPAGEIGQTTYPAAKVLANAGLREDAMRIFTQSCFAVIYRQVGNFVTAFIEFKIMQDEAEYLTGTEWMEIRPIDLYPLFTTWVEAEFVSRMYGKTSVSISKIASTLPPYVKGDERVDRYNIAVNMNGEPLWIPKDCDNTQRYEQTFSSAATQNQHKNGDFGLRSVGSDIEPTLPINIPILTDWVNNKFTYSSTVGKPVVLDLAHMRKFNASMAMNVLKRPVPDKYIKNLSFYATECKIPVSAQAYGADLENTSLRGVRNDIVSWMDAATAAFFAGSQRESLRFYDIMQSLDTKGTDDELAEFKPVATFIKRLHQAMIENIDALYVKYAVSTMTEALGLISVLATYGGDIGTTTSESNTINKPATDQGVDPNWKPPEAPLLTGKFSVDGAGLLPHQLKVRNIMRTRPDNAAWPIDAGGGKSMLTITDILYEIKAGESYPYLVMCPSHLVANYVSEIVEFTDGKVNVIPVTSYNVKTTGVKRFEEILTKAPINTILVVDYDALKFGNYKTVYGTAAITIYPVVDMMRQFAPGYVMMDESHFLRNVGRARFKAVMSLVADVKKKRIASGTMNPDSPSDLPGQMAILDPTIFGSRQDFNDTYAEKIAGGRVISWNTKGPNAVSTVLSKLKNNIVWAPAKRKEWACALPDREDRFIAVELTDNQKVMYDAIFDDLIQLIKSKAETDKKAKKLLDSLTGKAASPEDEKEFGDLGDVPGNDEDDEDDEGGEGGPNADDDVGAGLQPYLADIERFVTNPAGHPYARNGFMNAAGERIPPLTGEDLKSPKAIELEKQLREHLSQSEAKVLIFTNYNESTDTLFAAMPADLRACGILYKTSFKTEMVNRFKTDPKIRWMIGIRNSLEVGLNFQVADYLIRVEGVWTPGEQEQGDSRIARPDFNPNSKKRKKLRFDTLVANHTIDITKAARLRAKIIDIAKFDNQKDPNYESIQSIPVLPMNLDNIQNRNDFSTNLAQYQSSMIQLNNVMKAEYDAYKAEMVAAGGFKMTPVVPAPNPTEAAILARVPYAQGTELYKASELGLVRVDNFIGLELSREADEEGDDTDDDVTEDENDHSAAAEERRRVIKEQTDLVMGRRVHTDLGDGYIMATGAAKKGNFIMRLVVRFEDGTVGRNLRVTNVFIVTRTETNGIDMRNKIAEAAGLRVTAPITVPSFNTVQRRKTKQEQEEEDKREAEKHKKDKKVRQVEEKKTQKVMTIGLELSLVNGYMRLSYEIGANERVVKALEANGFRRDPMYYMTRIRHYKHLMTQCSKWQAAGFKFNAKFYEDTFAILAAEMKSGGVTTHRHYDRLIGAANFKNYLRQEFKASADNKLLTMFALVTDGGDTDPDALKDYAKEGVAPHYGAAYLCLPYGPGHPGSKAAVNPAIKAPSSKWIISPPSLSIFVNTARAAAKVTKQLIEAGINVENLDELNKDAANVKKATAKNDEFVDVVDDEPDAKKGKAPVKKAKK